jgi:hypothetical protein
MSQTLPVPIATAALAPAVRQPKPKTHMPAIDHALKAYALQRDRAMRLAYAAGAVRMFAFGLDHESWDELWKMQSAAQKRMGQLQVGWMRSWFAWLRYSDQIEGANTLSKLAEREYNIAAQATQLTGEQSASLMALLENVEVDFLYWVAQKSAPA